MSATLTGRTIVLTGGSGFLGSAMATHLLGCGARVVNLGRRRPRVPSGLAKGLTHIAVDFYDTQRLRAELESVAGIRHRIDVLVNNSFDFSPRTGFNDPSGRLETISKETFMRGLDSGVYWALLCSQVIGRRMIKQGGGHIINVGSLYSFLVADYRMYKGRKIFNPVTYPVSKHALLGLSRYIASFWSAYNIRCNVLTPGTFPNIGEADEAQPNRVKDEAFIDVLRRKCSTGRVGKAEDLLSALEFLCSDKSSYMTGANLVVDGGWSAL